MTYLLNHLYLVVLSYSRYVIFTHTTKTKINNLILIIGTLQTLAYYYIVPNSKTDFIIK